MAHFEEDHIQWVLRNSTSFQGNFDSFVDCRVHEALHEDCVDDIVHTFMTMGKSIIAFRSCFQHGSVVHVARAMLQNTYYKGYLHGMRYGAGECGKDLRFHQYRAAMLHLATFVGDKDPADAWDESDLCRTHALVTSLKEM